jgi:hypothetical protein
MTKYGCAALAATALAQESPAEYNGRAGIIVTAQKCEQRLQDVPIAVTALSGAARRLMLTGLSM